MFCYWQSYSVRLAKRKQKHRTLASRQHTEAQTDGIYFIFDIFTLNWIKWDFDVYKMNRHCETVWHFSCFSRWCCTISRMCLCVFVCDDAHVLSCLYRGFSFDECAFYCDFGNAVFLLWFSSVCPIYLTLLSAMIFVKQDFEFEHFFNPW